MINLGQLQHIHRTDPKLYETLKQLVDSHNLLNNLHGIDTSGAVTAPQIVGMLTVTAANGIFRATIIDKSNVSKGVAYFLEHDTTASFLAPVTVHLGPSRDWLEFLGSGTFFFRAWSQYPLSPPSKLITFGTPPTGVAGGGALAAPAPLAEQGSGTSSLPGNGFGVQPRQGPGQTPRLS